MFEPFESPKFLLDLTGENVTEFDAICGAFFRNARAAKMIHVDPETGNKTHKLIFGNPIPNRARHIAATAISDIRHSLDQATCASVRLLTGSVPDKLYFPFATNPNDLNGRLRKTIPEPLHPILRTFEPYPRGQGYVGGNDILSKLSSAAGPNKHQATCAAGGRIASFSADSIVVREAVGPFSIPPRWDASKNEMVLATVAPDGDVQYNFQMTFFVAFKDAGQLSEMPVSAVVRDLLSIAKRIVVGLETETARILGTV